MIIPAVRPAAANSRGVVLTICLCTFAQLHAHCLSIRANLGCISSMPDRLQIQAVRGKYNFVEEMCPNQFPFYFFHPGPRTTRPGVAIEG
jgi:hypothetical protein